jgi:hypothetical protein
MGRFRRWLGIGTAGLAVAASVMALRIRRSFVGPSMPACRAPSLVKKTFEKAVAVSGPEAPGARRYDTEPSAALTSSGALVIAWQARDGVFRATSGLGLAEVDLEGKVTARRAYPTERAEVFDVWLASTPGGKLHLVWLGHDGGRPERNMMVGHAESARGLDFGAPANVHAAADCPPEARGCLDKPMVAAGPDALHVFYAAEPEGLRVRTRREGEAGFGPSVAIGGDAFAGLHLAPSGNIHLVFTEIADGGGPEADRFGGTLRRMVYTKSEDGGRSFSAHRRVSEDGEPVPLMFSNPGVQADEARGFVYVVYPAGRPDGRWIVRLAISNDGGAHWTRVTVNDDPPCANHMTPAAALDPETGKLHVTWLENRDGTGALAYAVCEPGGARCGPSEAVSDAPFASYRFERHLSAWLGDYGALVLDPKRRWLHAVWTQPVFEDGAPTSRIFHARARLQ